MALRRTVHSLSGTVLKEGGRTAQSVLFTNGKAQGEKMDATPLNRMLFKVTQGSYYAVRVPLLRAGFKRVSKDSVHHCNLVWRRPFSIGRGKKPSDVDPDLDVQEVSDVAVLEVVHPHQWTNHFPGSYVHLGSKDGMWDAIKAAAGRARDPAAFDITPTTWILPDEHAAVAQFLADHPGSQVITKPARGSCGRDIFVGGGEDPRLQKLLTYATAPQPPPAPSGAKLRSRKWVVQKYLDPPMVIHKRKYDVRIYVAVTSVAPLVAYVFQEGLVRFASEEYTATSSSRLSHLTNSSLSRKRDAALRGEPKDKEGNAEAVAVAAVAPPPPLSEPLDPWQVRSRDVKGAAPDQEDPTWPRFKWSLSELQEHIKKEHGGAQWDAVWRGIEDVTLKALIAAERPISAHLAQHDVGGVYTNQSFELFGVDVMVDADFKPWLIEVNCIPSLESSSSMDWAVKCGCITDLLNMLMMKPFERSEEDMRLRCMIDSLRERLEEDKAKEEDQQDAALQAELQAELAQLLGQLRAAVAGAPPPPVEHCFDATDFAQRVADEARYRGGYRRIFPTAPAVADNAEHFVGSPSEERNRMLWEAMGFAPRPAAA
eukprot:TRINITY_DN16507_c0_g1_i1.p1 TRINITY_DN16507_c0_g1~~TRINITY_DN16507_c0_g1_i1.p1  ORF type:complete len:597 (+),score=210.43 TRINITY_DN16507_c0_g1_i1:57-1847(+)